MRQALRITLTLSVLVFITAPAVWAEVPTNTNVQGRLTDSTGAPVAAGFYMFTFRIFDTEVGGSQVWPLSGAGETQTITVDALGLWNACVGEDTALTEAVFVPDTSRWLEVTVDNGITVETLPRIKLKTNPYSFQSASSQGVIMYPLGGIFNPQRQIIAHSPGVNFDWGLAYDDSSDQFRFQQFLGDAAPSMAVDLANLQVGIGTIPSALTGVALEVSGSGVVQAGGGSTDGEYRMQNGGQTAVQLRPFSTSGGSVLVDDISGNLDGVFESDGSGDGIYFWLNAGNSSFNVQNIGGGDLGVDINGTNATRFRPEATGTSAVQFPANAISDFEIEDEPGIASSFRNTTVTLTTIGQATDTVSITVPMSGFVVVTYHSFILLNHTLGTRNFARGGIGTSPSAIDFDNSWFYEYDDQEPTGSGLERPVSCSQVTSVSAGAHTYFHVAEILSSGPVSLGRGRLTAMFFPTNYGTVDNSVPPLAGRGEPATDVGEEFGSKVQRITVSEREEAIAAELASVRAELEQIRVQNVAIQNQLRETAERGDQ